MTSIARGSESQATEPVDHGPDGPGVFIRNVGMAFHCRCGKADFVAGYPCSAMNAGDTYNGEPLRDR